MGFGGLELRTGVLNLGLAEHKRGRGLVVLFECFPFASGYGGFGLFLLELELGAGDGGLGVLDGQFIVAGRW